MDLSTSLTTGVTPAEFTDPDSVEIIYWANGYPLTYSVFFINLAIIIVHIGIAILNSLMIEAIRQSRQMEEPAGHCLISLSLSYIWLCVMMIYTGIYGLANMQDKNECLLRFGLLHSAFILVCWSNCLLTIDRFLQVEFPFWYDKKMKIGVIWTLNSVATLLSIFYSLSPLIFDWYKPQSKREHVCEYFNILPAPYLMGFFLVTLAGFIIMVLIYSRLLCIACAHQRTLKRISQVGRLSTLSLRRQHPSIYRQWRPVKIAVAITGVYLLSWAPPGIYGLYLSADPTHPKDTKYVILITSLILIPSLSGVINPFIYTRHRDIKKRFINLLRCGGRNINRWGGKRSSQTTSSATTTNTFSSSSRSSIRKKSLPQTCDSPLS